MNTHTVFIQQVIESNKGERRTDTHRRLSSQLEKAARERVHTHTQAHTDTRQLEKAVRESYTHTHTHKQRHQAVRESSQGEGTQTQTFIKSVIEINKE